MMPPQIIPAGYLLMRTDWVDWNSDGFCDVAYLYAPEDLTARKALGGYAVHFFTSTQQGKGWEQVKKIHHSGSTDVIRPGATFPCKDYHAYGENPSSHFLVGDLLWTYSPGIGVILATGNDYSSLYRWSVTDQAFVPPEGSGGSDDTWYFGDMLSEVLKAAHTRQEYKHAINSQGIRNIAIKLDSPDLHILRAMRVICLLRADLPCLLKAAEASAMHPAADWQDIGALHDAAQISAEQGGQESLADSAAYLQKYAKYWRSDLALWRDWYKVATTKTRPVASEAIAAANRSLTQHILPPSADKRRAEALIGYWLRKNFSPWRQGVLPDGRHWQIGLSDAALALRVSQNWKSLMALPWADYVLPSADDGEPTCDNDACRTRKKNLSPALWRPGTWSVKGKGGSRTFEAYTPNSGMTSSGASVSGNCNLVDQPAYFQLNCSIGYDGGAHPDISVDEYFFAKRPGIFGRSIEARFTCADAKYSRPALRSAWNDLLAQCAFDSESEDKGSKLTKRNFKHWLNIGRKIVRDGGPVCSSVQLNERGRLAVVAETGMIARSDRGTPCDQVSTSVPVLNPRQYVQAQLKSRDIVTLLDSEHGGPASHQLLLLEDSQYNELDAELNRAYQALLKEAPENSQAKIRTAQRMWLQKRDQLIAGNPPLVENTCAIDGCQPRVPYQGSINSYLAERVEELKTMTARLKAQKDLVHNPFSGRLPKCVTPLMFNQCDVPILVTWCWDVEGKLSQWHENSTACAKVGKIISRIEPDSELTAPMPHSDYSLGAKMKIFSSCIADDKLAVCRPK